MTSERLLSIVRCPDCGGTLTTPSSVGASAASPVDVGLACQGCGRLFANGHGGFLDLRPAAAFRETTKYVDEALHADWRHQTVSPPLLSAAIRNDMLRAMLAPTSADRIVDLGCGSGRVLVWNRDWGAYQVGVDVSPYFAHQAIAQVDLILGDLRKLPMAEGSFTKAFSLDVAEHLSREGLVAMLTEARRVLAAGGGLFLYTHARKNSPLARGLWAVNRIANGLERLGLLSLEQERLRKSDHINPLADIDDLRQVAAQAGFRVACLRYYTPLVGAVVENLIVRLAESALARRAARRLRAPGARHSDQDLTPLRAARLEAKQRIERRGPSYAVLRALTWLMKLDILLFSRIESGPFFALLIAEESQRGSALA